jgi:hypothetical protein
MNESTKSDGTQLQRNWAEKRNGLLRQAQILHVEAMSMQGKFPTSELTYDALGASARDGISMTQALARFVWKHVSPDVKEASQARMVEGICGIIPHGWFLVELRDDPQAQPNWKYIIDPCALDVIPSVLLIGPESPWHVLYQERTIVDQKGC